MEPNFFHRRIAQYDTAIPRTSSLRWSAFDLPVPPRRRPVPAHPLRPPRLPPAEQRLPDVLRPPPDRLFLPLVVEFLNPLLGHASSLSRGRPRRRRRVEPRPLPPLVHSPPALFANSARPSPVRASRAFPCYSPFYSVLFPFYSRPAPSAPSGLPQPMKRLQRSRACAPRPGVRFSWRDPGLCDPTPSGSKSRITNPKSTPLARSRGREHSQHLAAPIFLSAIFLSALASEREESGFRSARSRRSAVIDRRYSLRASTASRVPRRGLRRRRRRRCICRSG